MTAKVEHHLDELFPRVSFTVTASTGTHPAVVGFYDQWGTAEQWIKGFRADEVRLLLGAIANSLGNLLCRLVLRPTIQG